MNTNGSAYPLSAKTRGAGNDKSAHDASFTDMFKSELDALEHYRRVVNTPDISFEELLDEYRLLGERYDTLLKQAAKLTRIGDVAQRKLINTKAELAAQSAIIERANGELQEKNERLKESIEEINQLNLVLGKEQAKADSLLLNILPPDIAARLKEGEDKIADYFEEATVVFTDIVGFTNLASLVSATTIVKLLNTLFSRFDALLDRYEVEKIKTIGDSYMLAAGIPTPREDHAHQAAEFAFAMHSELRRYVAETGYPISMRIGMHSGPVVAGIIGTRKFVYDLWGDTVNIASRMESHGLAGKVHCSETVYAKLLHRYRFEHRGAIDIKGKGKMETYFLLENPLV